MGETTLATIVDRLWQDLGDYISEVTTTNITTDNDVISTHFVQWDRGNNTFIDWWAYIEGVANPLTERQISDYVTTTGVVTVRGAALAAESAAMTVRLSKYRRTDLLRAIVDAIREIYPALHLPVDNRTLVTGNILPNSHFENWTLTTIPDKWASSGTSQLVTEENTIIRGGTSSAKLDNTGAAMIFYCSHLEYPRLLDLQGKTVTFKAWVNTDTASHARLQIYTKQADGTEQTTLLSSYHSGGSEYELLELEDQDINDDLTDIAIRVTTSVSDKFVYVDDARVTGLDLDEYLLPLDLQNGAITQVDVQSRGHSDDICDDLHLPYWQQVVGWDTISDGADKYIKLPFMYPAKRRIRLLGTTPLETLAVAADTISLDGDKINLLVAYSKYVLFRKLKSGPTSEDTNRFRIAEQEAYNEFQRLLPNKGMGMKGQMLNLPVY